MEYTGEYAIEIKDLTKRYGEIYAVNGLSFKVLKGEIFGMLGPNGAGKSTTIEILTGLRNRDAGDVSILDMDPQKDPATIKKVIGIQLQSAALFPRLTIKETIELFASFYPNPAESDEMIDIVGLREKKNTLIKNLSGGQLQRVSVAIAMIGNGDIIFFDEPTAGLDPQSRRRLWDIIISLKERGKTVFITTHFMDEAQTLCDRVAVVDHGKVIAIGKPQELIKEHFPDIVLEFVHSGLAKDERVKTLNGVSSAQINGDCITLHTEDVSKTIMGLMEISSMENVVSNNITIRQSTLEDVFLKLTGRVIRE